MPRFVEQGEHLEGDEDGTIPAVKDECVLQQSGGGTLPSPPGVDKENMKRRGRGVKLQKRDIFVVSPPPPRVALNMLELEFPPSPQMLVREPRE